MIRPILALLVVSLGLLATGCSTSAATRGAYETADESRRDSERARALTLEAVALMQTEPAAAEARLRAALNADLYHGPAHNNLGVLLLERGDLYGAAQEFQWASRLLPGHPDPRLNLALTFEDAGRVGDAIDSCELALEVYDGHIPSSQALARLQLLHQRTDERTDDLLRTVALAGEDDVWRTWAREQLIRRGR
ncbi:MAG: hypothetical protein AB8G96_09980 [Phycisphaerales bacterium]